MCTCQIWKSAVIALRFFPLKSADLSGLGTRDEPQRTSVRLAQWARTRRPSQFLTQSYLSRHCSIWTSMQNVRTACLKGKLEYWRFFLRLVYMYPWAQRETQGAKFLSRQPGLTYLASNDQRLDNPIQWITQLLVSLISWIVVFPVDSTIQFVHKRGQQFEVFSTSPSCLHSQPHSHK